jgi:uncharacterized protein YcsI (UPF0317 family)
MDATHAMRQTASSLSPTALRQMIRQGLYDGPTCGLAPGYVQANLVILPLDWAGEFQQFCWSNPKPCPLLHRTALGSPHCPEWGSIDLRSDLPRYRVFRNGELVDSPTDIGRLWQNDLVGFLIGCSFSFEEALIEAGLPVRHVQLGRNVPMYITNRPCAPAGRFHGALVVSMRPIPSSSVERVIEVTGRFERVHGAPVHVGDPAELGVADIDCPDFGDAVPVHDNEVPVFWACGVTPQRAIAVAKPPLAITHVPGCMLVTDIPNRTLASSL